VAVEDPVDSRDQHVRDVLDADTWGVLRAAHEERVDAWVQPHLARRRDGVPHPVEDFLFTYYSQRPAALRRWHPGYGVVLEGGEEYIGLKGYGVVSTSSTSGGVVSTSSTSGAGQPKRVSM
jgi:hypothetical protein